MIEIIKPKKSTSNNPEKETMFDLKNFIQAGVHFGHQKSRWHPRMARYIWGHKNQIHLIDVSKTAIQLEKAARFLKEVAERGEKILWVGTKKPAQDIMNAIADRLRMPVVSHRWVGGTLSNFIQVKKSVTKLLHFEDVIERAGENPHYTKKELNTFQKKVDRLNRNVGGIRNLAYPIGAIFIVDVRKERSALKEANRMGIPVVAIVDTNNDPSGVNIVIPGNDDAKRAIEVITDILAQAVEEGMLVAQKREEQERELRKNEAIAKAEVKKKVAADAPATELFDGSLGGEEDEAADLDFAGKVKVAKDVKTPVAKKNDFKKTSFSREGVTGKKPAFKSKPSLKDKK